MKKNAQLKGSPIVAVDVQYSGGTALAGAVMFDSWQQERPHREWVQPVARVAPYTPGEFYRRELPCLLAVLGRAPCIPRQVIIDGYVWLSSGRRAGLGAHLFRELGGSIAIIGVAKTCFRSAPAQKLFRGGSQSPLFVTAAGCDLEEAVEHVRVMAGEHRVPTLLKRADQLARGINPPMSLGPLRS